MSHELSRTISRGPLRNEFWIVSGKTGQDLAGPFLSQQEADAIARLRSAAAPHPVGTVGGDNSLLGDLLVVLTPILQRMSRTNEWQRPADSPTMRLQEAEKLARARLKNEYEFDLERNPYSPPLGQGDIRRFTERLRRIQEIPPLFPSLGQPQVTPRTYDPSWKVLPPKL